MPTSGEYKFKLLTGTGSAELRLSTSGPTHAKATVITSEINRPSAALTLERGAQCYISVVSGESAGVSTLSVAVQFPAGISDAPSFT